MSKEKPEVGDVWEVNGRKIRLEQVGEKYNEEYVYHIGETPLGLKGYSIYTVSFIKAVGKYLGKSKAKTKELFDVKD